MASTMAIKSLAAAAACSVSLLTPASMAFIIRPRQALPSASAIHLYREDNDNPYPSGSKKSLVNVTAPNNDDAPDANNGDGSIITPNDEIDIVGAGSLGDIMAGSGSKSDITKQPSPTAIIDGLVTKEGGELNTRFAGCNFTPMERIALTANGNLQRIFSSYYDAPVHVHVDSCTRRKPSDIPQIGFNHSSVDFDPTIERPDVMNSDAIWDRVVHIQVHDQTIVKATSIISVQSPLCIQLIEDGSVGLGQMFRYLNKLPTFSLLDAGRTSSSSEENIRGLNEGVFQGGMWRTYELQCEELTCLIHEEFHRDAWRKI